MKLKLVVGTLALVSTAAMAAAPAAVTISGTGQAFCQGDAGTAAITPASPAGFIQVQFTQACSQNVFMHIAENNTSAWGAAASKKGKFYFIGNTNGGAPRSTGTEVPAAANPDTSTKMTEAAAMGSS